MLRIFKAFIILLPFVFLTSCGEEEEPEPMEAISEDFDIIGTWNFQQVSGEGVIFGIEREDTDNMPTGFVRFESDSTGVSEFSVELLGLDYSKEETFTWKRLSESQVELRQSDGETDTWNIIRANPNIIEASWLIIRAGNQATLTTIFTP